MPFEIKLGHGINDYGQQRLGLAYVDGKKANGTANNVLYMHCALCGHDYMAHAHTIGRRRCPACQRQSSQPAEAPEGTKFQPNMVKKIHLKPHEVALALTKLSNGSEFPDELLAYIATQPAARELLAAGEQKTGFNQGPPLPGKTAGEAFFNKPSSGAKKTGVKYHVTRKGADPDGQKQLALSEGLMPVWDLDHRVKAAQAQRDSYLTATGLKDKAAPWDSTGEVARSLWLNIVDDIVRRYEKASGKKALRTDI